MMNSATKKEVFFIFILLVFNYAYFYHDGSWNGNSRLALTFAMVEEGRLTIDSFHERGDMFTEDKAIYNGHYYTSKAIGSSLIAALYYFPLYHVEQLLNIDIGLNQVKYLLTFLSIGLPSALAGSLMYILCKRVTGETFRAYVATIAIALGTMAFPYSVTFFGHQLAGAFLFAAFFLIFYIQIEPAFHRKSVLFLIGFLLGFGLITEYPVAPVVLILTAYYFWNVFRETSFDRRLAVLLPALGALIPLGIVLAYNTAVFETPISTGYVHSAYPWFRENQTQGLVGIGWPRLDAMYYMTLHPAYGIFFQSPVLILSLVGIWLMMREPIYRVEALVAITAFLSLLVLYSGFYSWWGAWTFAPRYIIPMLPFLCLPLVFVPGRWFVSVVVTGLISIFQMFIAVASRIIIPDDFIKQIDQVGFFAYSTIYTTCLQLLLNGEFAKNIGIKFLGLNTWISLVPPLLAILIVTWIFVARRGTTKSRLSLPNQAVMEN